MENVIFKIQGVQYYLDSIDNFWAAPHGFSHLTNKEYMARSMAAQLQCASSLRREDHSLNLESVDLMLRLAHPTLIPDVHFFRVALTPSAHNANIPLIGVFLISRKAEDLAGEANPCVLYVPGTDIQQFNSIASMKIHLATYLINPTVSPNPLPYCVALSQQNVLRNLTHRGALDEHSLNLTPVPVSPDFFRNHIQLLIDQQKQDITYMWSQTEYSTPPADLPGFVPRYYINRTAFEFFGNTVKHHAIPVLDAWQKNQIPTVLPESPQTVEPEDIPPVITPGAEKTLKPIKLHVILHRDLETDWTDTLLGLFFLSNLRTYTFDSIKKDYFSWLIDELETLSGRKVEMIQITKDEASDLYTFDYSSDTSTDAITRWEKAVSLFLQKASRTPSPLEKFILLTRNAVVPGQLNGVANKHGGQFAIATVDNFRTAAHEVGHLLDARHDAGGIIYNGWWSETLMVEYDFFSPLRTNAYRFSDQNRERIKDYLKPFD